MEAEANEGGGTTITLVSGDRLDKVPKTHQELLTPAIREVFSDPIGHFRRVADKCPFPQMAAWLNALLADGEWYLALHRGDPKEWESVGFGWFSDAVRSAEITPSIGEDTAGLPAMLRRYYSLVDRVQWMPFGCAGGLEGAAGHTPMTTFPLEYHGATIDPANTFAFGWSPGGDILIYTDDGRGGWACHENGKVYLLGTIEDTINWVYAELLGDRCPDFNYDWA
jgi:hypothetical protein